MNPAVALYRLGRWFHCNRMPLVGWGLSWVGRFLFATWLPASASIGRRFVCGYWGLGVVIHKDAVIGDDCVIAQNVTIGRNPEEAGVPVLGDRVYVGAGAVIVGGLTIGDDAAIGANSVVLHDVPPGGVAVGVPARIARIKPGHASDTLS
jgi:serine O-acetyltransferase